MYTKYLLFAALIASITFAACKQDKTGGAQQSSAQPTADITHLTGHWIAMDFISRANQYGSVLAAMNNAHAPYAFTVTFDSAFGDSVMCYNGMESYKLPYTIRVDTIELKGARQGKSIFMIYDSQAQGQKDMTMFDGTMAKTQIDRFIRSNSTVRDGYLAFLLALNHNLFSGQFTSLRKSNIKGPVVFAPTGALQNLPEYDRYELCTAGDCFVTGDEIDVIELYNSKQPDNRNFFGYRYGIDNDTLTIYNLINEKPDEKGAYKVGGVAYQFLRKKPQ
ncbi:MAG TPA: hypothetical protein PLW66_15365 [Saprospiraceae bacterium]|nr:hypothetical protein [Saprospiraceae bacterium]